MQRSYSRTFSAALISLFLLLWIAGTASAGVPSTAARWQTGPYLIANGAVYVREGPGTGFSVLGVLYQGEIVPILAVSPDNAWWYANTRFGQGWVSNSGVTASNTSGISVRDPGPTGTAIAPVVNVRSGPGPTAAVVSQLRQGQQVFIIGRNDDGTWLQIRTSGTTGWVSATFMTATGVAAVTSSSLPVTADAPYGIVSVAFLNVRSGPGQNYSSLGRVAGGEILPIVARSSDNAWYQVNTNVGLGWVSAAYIIPRNEFGTAPVVTQNPSSAEVTGPTAVINTGALNLRSGPGSQYSSLGTLAGGEEGRIIGRSADWTWYLLETRLGNGWANGQYLVLRGETGSIPYVTPGTTVQPSDGQGGGSAPEPALANPVAVVTTGALNIRSGPNSAFSSLGSVYAGAHLTIIGQSPDRGWWLVESPYGNGWVTKTLVVVNGNTANIPVSNP